MQLQLTNGTYTDIDNEDFDRLSKFNWTDNKTCIERCEGEVKSGYAKRWRTIHISIANEIMQTRGVLYDHRDRNYRNNCKKNLRVCTYQQNAMNNSKMKHTSSKYKGVSFYERDKVWHAYIRFSGKLLYLGRFKIEEEAARAYNVKAKELFGEFAVLNNC
jgi:hypothetical protein